MSKKAKVNEILKTINKDIDKIKIYNEEKIEENENLNISVESLKKLKENSFMDSKSESSIIKSFESNASQMTYMSQPFNEEKDLDLPNCSSTKYVSFNWKLTHCLFYFFYSLFLLVSTIFWSKDGEDDNRHYNIFLLISHVFYSLSTFMEWSYHFRGCIKPSNLNSIVKENIDKTFKARILRGEEGCKYFFSFLASIILLYGNIYYIVWCDRPDPEYFNINLVGSIIICLSQILKFDKILTQSKQYKVINDLSLCLIEICLFFGALSFGTSYFIQMTYNYDRDNKKSLFSGLKFTGNGLIIFSSLSLFQRYFCSDFDDLNTSDLSTVTL